MAHVPLYSIGYGNARSVEDFIALLHQFDVQYLVDVRSRPYSKYRPEFCKDVLATIIQNAGMKYLFLGDALGGMPDDPACLTDGKPDYALIAQQEWFVAGLDRLTRGMRDGHCIAMMCAEADPERCHRTRLIGENLKLRDIELSHIDKNGEVLSQAQAMARVHQGQGMLFGSRATNTEER